jgi:hypothetical protein
MTSKNKTEAGPSATPQDYKQKKQKQIPPLRCGMTKN